MGILSFVTGGLLGGLSDSANRKAANKARDAVTQAADADRALYERIYNQSRGDLQPYNQAGQEALNALRVRMGLTPMSGGRRAPVQAPAVSQPKPQGGFAGTSPMEGPVAGAQSPAQPSAPDWQGYLAANPDVAQQAAVEGRDPVEYAQAHYQAFGQAEGRQLPMSGGQAADPNAPAPEYFQESYAARPADMPVPTFQRAPDMAAPGAFRYTPQDIENDVGYRFARDEALNGVNAFSAARGRLRSGDAAKALQDRAAGVAHQWDNDYFNRALQTYNVNTDAYRYGQNRADNIFSADRGYGTDLWATQQGRRDNIFSEDRGFTADRFDQGTSNLFGLVSAGQGAAAGTAAAGNVFARGASDANQTAAAARANATLAKNQFSQGIYSLPFKAAGAFLGGGF